MDLAQLFETNVQYVKGVGPYYRAILAKRGIHTLYDLLSFFPRNYEDRTELFPLLKAIEQQEKNVVCKLETAAIDSIVVNNRRIPKIIFTDGVAACEALLFSGRVPKSVAVGATLYVTGKYSYRFRGIQCAITEIEAPNEKDHYSYGRIVPIYPLTEGLSQKKLRALIKPHVERLCETPAYEIPLPLRRKRNLMSYARAVYEMHFPSSFDRLEEAKRALIYEEFLAFQYLSLSTRRPPDTPKPVRSVSVSLQERVKETLPYALTKGQENALTALTNDITSAQRMFRLLQGDVGSGKTIVSFLAAMVAVEAKGQCAFLVPTELLAQQHAALFKTLGARVGVRVDLLTAAVSASERSAILARARKGETNILVGTHALFPDDVVFKRLALLVVDEQQRFGVKQRDRLLSKGDCVDYLLMSATPIPQSLAMALFGELELSTIEDMPPGRLPVKTKWARKEDRAHCHAFLRARIKNGEQAYVVFPAIEEGKIDDILALKNEYALAKETYCKEFRLGMAHGKMDDGERARAMELFAKGEIDVLFATSVIEVGIDNPNATTVIVEGAERFGLSQLHQLRGRVGRSGKQGYCYLVTHGETTDAAALRMETMTETNDGFKIAEVDLALRGPGEFLGVKQSGLPEFKLGDIIADNALMQLARADAKTLLETPESNRARSDFILRVEYLNRYYISKDDIDDR